MIHTFRGLRKARRAADQINVLVLPLRRLLNVLSVLVAAAVAVLVARHFARAGWPIHEANVPLVMLAGAALLGSYALKAWGWSRLFRAEQRPAVLTLAAAGGAASVGGVALPGRCDELIRIAVVRRCRTRRSSIAAVVLSLFVLGLIDSAAMSPLAAIAAAAGGASGLFLAALIVVAAAGVGAAAVVVALPRLARARRLGRFRVVGWMREHVADPREAARAWLLVFASWGLRALAVFALLTALGVATSLSLALLFLCASAASAVLPVAPAGAATQAGAGAAILSASGVHTDKAIAFAVAAQGLVIGAGAVFVLALVAVSLAAKVRGALPAEPAPVAP